MVAAPDSDRKPSAGSCTQLIRLVLLALVAAAVLVGYLRYGDALTLERLATKEATLRRYQQDSPALVFGLAFLLYVTVTGLSLPGALVLSLSFAWYFGLFPAFILVSFASTLGATLAFLLSRYLFRDAIQTRFGSRLHTFNQRLEKEGAFYLFTLRLIPAVPFFVINLVMGLTPIKTWTFWWVSQLGMLPGTLAYVYAGSRVPRLSLLAEKGVRGILSPQLVFAFVILGLLPFAAKKLVGAGRAAQAKRI